MALLLRSSTISHEDVCKKYPRDKTPFYINNANSRAFEAIEAILGTATNV